MINATALCPVCQRIIYSGAYYDSLARVWLLHTHPAAGANFEISNKSWVENFNEYIHRACAGSGQQPERIITRKRVKKGKP